MMLLAPVTNWEPHGVTLAGYCYVMRHGLKVQIVTVYRVGHLQRYGVTVRGKVTSVYPVLPILLCLLCCAIYQVAITRHESSSELGVQQNVTARSKMTS
jgi:hypothetical protein